MVPSEAPDNIKKKEIIIIIIIKKGTRRTMALGSAGLLSLLLLFLLFTSFFLSVSLSFQFFPLLPSYFFWTTLGHGGENVVMSDGWNLRQIQH